MKTQTTLLIITLAACLSSTMGRPGRTLFQSPLVTTVPDPKAPSVVEYTMNGTTDSSEVTCRGEPLCLSQVCNPDAYQYDIATQKEEFPYAVSYTTTNSLSTTTFVFMVCAKGRSLGLCGVNNTNPACGPVKSFNLRIRDIDIESGATLIADPAGSNWASCKPSGPGYLWDNLPATNACQSLSVTIASEPNVPATLSNLCQQNVTIADNKGNTVLDTSTLPENCFFSIENYRGRTGFGTIIDRASMTSAGKDATTAEETTGSEDGNGSSSEETSDVTVETTEVPDQAQVDAPIESTTGPTPYGGGKRKILRATSTTRDVRRMF